MNAVFRDRENSLVGKEQLFYGAGSTFGGGVTAV